MLVARMSKAKKEEAGIWKLEPPRYLSMDRAWRIMKLLNIPTIALNMTLEDHSGIILIRVFKSSTSCTVLRLHDLALEPSDSIFNAPRFKNLHNTKKTKCYQECVINEGKSGLTSKQIRRLVPKTLVKSHKLDHIYLKLFDGTVVDLSLVS